MRIGRPWLLIGLALALSGTPLPGGPSRQQTTNAPLDREVGRICIPKISLDLPLREMAHVDDQQTLDRGPSHLAGSSGPGATGNCVIAGHRSTYSSPFRRLDCLQAGDRVIVRDPRGNSYRYLVDRVFVVNPDQVEVIAPTRQSTLTLITCHPLKSERQRLIVQGHLEMD
jgi:sortase A